MDSKRIIWHDTTTKFTYTIDEKLEFLENHRLSYNEYLEQQMNEINANFESIIRYGIIFYGQSTQIGRIFTIQKRTLRTILKMHPRESCRGKFKVHKLLTVTGIYMFKKFYFLPLKTKVFSESFYPQTLITQETLIIYIPPIDCHYRRKMFIIVV